MKAIKCCRTSSIIRIDMLRILVKPIQFHLGHFSVLEFLLNFT